MKKVELNIDLKKPTGKSNSIAANIKVEQIDENNYSAPINLSPIEINYRHLIAGLFVFPGYSTPELRISTGLPLIEYRKIILSKCSLSTTGDSRQ